MRDRSSKRPVLDERPSPQELFLSRVPGLTPFTAQALLDKEGSLVGVLQSAKPPIGVAESVWVCPFGRVRGR